MLSWILKPRYRCVDVRAGVGTIGHQDYYCAHSGVEFVAHLIHHLLKIARRRRCR